MVSSPKFRASTLSTPSAVQSHLAMRTENRMRRDDPLRTGSARDSLAADSSKPIATLSGRPLLSNRGIPLSLDWLKQVRINTSAVERRAQTHVARRTVKKDWQRSEEHTSELQSQSNLVCRLLLETKNKLCLMNPT